AFRMYARYRRNDARELEDGSSARDASERFVTGFRAEWDRPGQATMVEGEAYKGNIGNLSADRDVQGGHLLARWMGLGPGAGNLRVQAYYDRTERVHAATFAE